MGVEEIRIRLLALWNGDRKAGMIVLTIKITERSNGVLYQCEPTKQSTPDYTQAEVVVSKIIMQGVHEAMQKAAEEMACPITTMSVDGKKRKGV